MRYHVFKLSVKKKGTNLKILLIGLYRVSSTRTAPFEDRAEVNPFEEQSQ